MPGATIAPCEKASEVYTPCAANAPSDRVLNLSPSRLYPLLISRGHRFILEPHGGRPGRVLRAGGFDPARTAARAETKSVVESLN